jgi:hypothetical protein
MSTTRLPVSVYLSLSPYLDDSEIPHFHTRSTYLIYNTMTRSIVKKKYKSRLEIGVTITGTITTIRVRVRAADGIDRVAFPVTGTIFIINIVRLLRFI